MSLPIHQVHHLLALAEGQTWGQITLGYTLEQLSPHLSALHYQALCYGNLLLALELESHPRLSLEESRANYQTALDLCGPSLDPRMARHYRRRAMTEGDASACLSLQKVIPDRTEPWAGTGIPLDCPRAAHHVCPRYCQSCLSGDPLRVRPQLPAHL